MILFELVDGGFGGEEDVKVLDDALQGIIKI